MSADKTRQKLVRQFAARQRAVKPPKGDAAGGYRGIGTKYDSYGNPSKGKVTESFYPPGSKHHKPGKGMYSHVIGGRYGPKKRSFHGVSD